MPNKTIHVNKHFIFLKPEGKQMNKESLFKSHEKYGKEIYTELAETISLELNKALIPVYEKYKDICLHREFHYLVCGVSLDLHLEHLIDWEHIVKTEKEKENV